MLARALIGGIAGYIISQAVNPDNLVPLTLFWFFLGLSTASFYQQSLKLNRKFWLVFNAPTAILAVTMTLLAYRNLTAERYLLAAEKKADFSLAVATFKKSQAIFPYYSWYYVRLSDRLGSLVASGDTYAFRLAENAARASVRIAPLESDNYVALGTVYRLRATASRTEYDLNIALSNYRKALDLSPINYFATRDMALTLAALKNVKQAQSWLTRFQRLAPASEVQALEEEMTPQL